MSLSKTPTQQALKGLDSGEHTHIGLVKNILNDLSLCPILDDLFPDHRVILSFNIDGISLFNSSSIQFWPILGHIANHNKFHPFAIGIFCGKSKPQPLSLYLEDFVQELLLLLNQGFHYQDTHYSVQVYSFICDAPARSYIKCVKSHGGYSSCDKCLGNAWGNYFC